jgi:hypothetical protein
MADPPASAPPGVQDPAADRLDSWKEIAAYLKRGVSTVQRWEKEEKLPVHRHLHGKLGSVYAYKSELGEWWRDRRPGIEASEVASPRTARDQAPRPLLIVTGILGCLVLVAAWLLPPRRPASLPGSPKGVPLKSSQGIEQDPALSPDGRQLAFAWDGDSGKNLDAYVKVTGSSSVLRLTDSPDSECCLAWSPDLRFLAFVRLQGSQGVILTIPTGGGAERKLRGVTPWFGLSLSWSRAEAHGACRRLHRRRLSEVLTRRPNGGLRADLLVG